MIDRLDSVAGLLGYLSDDPPGAAHGWRGWRISPVAGGANNRLYRATGPAGDLAIKFTLRDTRDRAGREYAALVALRTLGLDLAPAPVLLERDRFPLPVVVQTWLPGEPLAGPPASESGWRALVEHYAAIHQVTPAALGTPLPDAVLTARSADEARRRVWQQVAQLPPEGRPAVLRGLVRRLDAWHAPRWPAPEMALARCDPNVRNILRRPGPWASVDWENSGWGDPAFEIADLMAHPSYLHVPEARWEWVIAAYVCHGAHASARVRIATYRVYMLVWWVARLARTLYEVPRGGDARLVARPAGWEADISRKLTHYAAAADAALASAGA
jgi:aminoglycoside phosphotransferase (APT) family kinase protein